MSFLNLLARLFLPAVFEELALSSLVQTLLCNSTENDLFVITESPRLEQTSRH